VTSVHGTALGVALDHKSELFGVLLLGPTGSGKSSLAAELIAHCPHQRTGLVADDLVRVKDGQMIPSPEGPLLHLRGLGIARVRPAGTLPLSAIVKVPGGEETFLSAPIGLSPDAFPSAAALRLLLCSLASGESLWCGFGPGP
jgi:energy-coupling factor transporter ATP-binding protein EcfA2